MKFNAHYHKCVEQMSVLGTSLFTCLTLHDELVKDAESSDPSKPEVQARLASYVRRSHAAKTAGNEAYQVIYDLGRSARFNATRPSFSESAYSVRVELDRVDGESQKALLESIARSLDV